MDRYLLERVRRQAWFHRYPRGLPIGLFLLVCLATATSVAGIEKLSAQRHLLMLERDTGEISAALQRRVAENVAVLHAAQSLFEIRDHVTAADFADMAADLEANPADYGAAGLGWAAATQARAIPALTAAMRADGASSFQVWPRTPGSTRPAIVVLYLQPQTAAKAWIIGYDMASEPVRREALEEAAKQRRAVASGKVMLLTRGAPPEPGFLIVMPVFEHGQRHGGRLLGFVYCPYPAADFLRSAGRLAGNRVVDVDVYDGAVSPDRLMASSHAAAGVGDPVTQSIQVANRTWLVSVSEPIRPGLTTQSQIAIILGAVFATLLLVITHLIMRRAVLDRDALEWQMRQVAIRTTLTRELNHRVKNTLANVLSIAMLTRRRSTDLDSFMKSFTARVSALSATHDLLTSSEWSNALIGDVVRSELGPYMQGREDHISTRGPEIAIAPNDALSLGMAIHELVTNAAKYGALSTEGGRLAISWQEDAADRVELNWRESGGPPVTPPSHRGFGMDLLERIVAFELQTEVGLVFASTGLECTLSVPIRKPTTFALRGGESG